ncbi:methyltransferase domain-containing protein [Reinekea marina]|uniref:RNA methyltransferase n=1 Tax=Reinekea marina TaxID=1310421 RepID=A0ABV7WT92_9GAMM|nr:methyltransferase domain-containing protein [Reinekea marina]MDN3650599.1 methyltransferase domain-containing protein [Reinekea marina]
MSNNLKTAQHYQCPVCEQPLNPSLRQFICENNHTFDVHKKGYLNLLLAHKKNSKAPGDDADMVESRRRFLAANHYQPLADFVAEQAQQLLPESATIWDAGCGEGYYTQIIAQSNPDFMVYGLDISKPAIQAASRFKEIHWSVASSAHPPYGSNSFDAIVSIFSRVDAVPFHRVLKNNGSVLMVVPDSDHLMGLRKIIYDKVRPYDTSKHLEYFNNGFELVSEQRITVPLNLTTNEAIFDLLGMTPHAHRLPIDKRRQLSEVASLTDTACFKLYHFRKSHQSQDQIS